MAARILACWFRVKRHTPGVNVAGRSRMGYKNGTPAGVISTEPAPLNPISVSGANGSASHFNSSIVRSTPPDWRQRVEDIRSARRKSARARVRESWTALQVSTPPRHPQP